MKFCIPDAIPGLQVLSGLSAEQLDDRSAVERQLYKAGVKVDGGSSLLS